MLIITQVIYPMQYAAKTFVALFIFISEDITALLSLEKLSKMIFYFKSWQQAQEVCNILRMLLPHSLCECLYTFTGTNSESFRVEAMALFELGIIRWLFATDAAGMRCDILDISTSVVYGLQDLCSAFQKEERASHQAGLTAQIIWLVEDGVFKEEDKEGLKETGDKEMDRPVDKQQRRQNQIEAEPCTTIDHTLC